jgi:hypothetical protein
MAQLCTLYGTTNYHQLCLDTLEPAHPSDKKEMIHPPRSASHKTIRKSSVLVVNNQSYTIFYMKMNKTPNQTSLYDWLSHGPAAFTIKNSASLPRLPAIMAETPGCSGAEPFPPGGILAIYDILIFLQTGPQEGGGGGGGMCFVVCLGRDG